jgi:inosose dehydratase
MSYDKYNGKVPHTVDVVARSKFTGIELMHDFMGDYYEDYGLTQDLFARSDVAFAALAFSQPWLGAGESEEERVEADKAIAFLEHFPQTGLMLYHSPVDSRDGLAEKQKNQIGICNEVARRAQDKGIVCSYHANSSSNAFFTTADDYYRLAELVDDRVLGLALDAGHMAKGRMDVVKMFGEFLPKIKHAHYKDMTEEGDWVIMGHGSVDFPAITKVLRDGGYDGWVMVEDESPLGETDPDAATIENGEYCASL